MIGIFDFYDGDAELEEKGAVAEKEVMTTSGDDRVATTQYATTRMVMVSTPLTRSRTVQPNSEQSTLTQLKK